MYDVLLSEEELARLPVAAQDTVNYHGYFDVRLGKHVLCGDDDRFVNHSENANLRFHHDHAVAARDIQRGEEITDNCNEYGKALQEPLWQSP